MMQADTQVTTGEKHQFDFWIGDWEATWGEGQHGTNHIEVILDGQVIQENFDGRPSMPLQGMSVSTYDTTLQKWQQTWVDNEGSYIHLTGEFKDDRMILYAQRQVGEALIKNRMVFYNISHEQFDWSWERSSDGQNWTPTWQIHYRRTK